MSSQIHQPTTLGGDPSIPKSDTRRIARFAALAIAILLLAATLWHVLDR